MISVLIFGPKQNEFLFNVSCLAAITHQMFDVSDFALIPLPERNELDFAPGLTMPFHTNGPHAR